MKPLVYLLAVEQQRKIVGITRRVLGCGIIGALIVFCVPQADAANKAKLSTFQHGKPVEYLPCDTIPLPKRTAVLMGGGLDVKAAYTWMITNMAQCTDGIAGKPGNFVVIRAGGNPSYDSFIFKLGQVASVQTLVVPTKAAANDPALEPYIRNAGAIWLTGGDQGDYYNFWQGTILERLISEQVESYGIPIGGTSAGMMILSEFNYIAYPKSISSSEALNDPYLDEAVTLKGDFWTNRTPFTPLYSTVTDSHFNFESRDHMGRLVTFLARVIEDGLADVSTARAIGVDQETALLMTYEPSKPPSVTVIANPGILGAAYFLSASSDSYLFVVPRQPLSFTKINVEKCPVTSPTINCQPVKYQLNVTGGDLTSTIGTIY